MSIRENFLPVKAHIKEHPARFHRFDAVWTPTVLLLDAAGKERVRLEGYLPNSDFMAALKAASPSCRRKYADAERWYGDVVAQSGDYHFAPEAMYWRAVAQYSATHDHTVLGRRGTAKQISVQRLGEQGSSVAALGAQLSGFTA